MKPVLVLVGILVLLAVVLGGMAWSSHSELVAGDESVKAAWSEIDNQYKRRADLIPQLVETVKGAAAFEQETLAQVVEARASVGRAQLPEGLPDDPAKLEAYLAAQRGLSGALGRLFALSENYPTLRASDSFRSLQDQLEGTENRIAVARRDYIDEVKLYNTALRTFPRNVLGGMLGFEQAPALPSDEAAREVPTIDFGNDG